MGIAVEEDRIVVEELDPAVPSKEAVGEFIIPADDVHVLKQLGVAAVYTPKDFDLNRIMDELVTLLEKRSGDKAA